MKASTYRRFPLRLMALPLLALALLPGPEADAQIVQREALVRALDSAAVAHVEHELVAGLSVAVLRGSDTLLLKGYGKADLEWDVETPVTGLASYEIGSMTKQFTAVAIMRLVEDGRIDLDADITTYLPDYDTHGHEIPVRRLLDHTSGIKGYTELPFFGEISVRKLPRDTLVTLVAAQPLDFEPGTALIYSNSAYFFLGLIIEEVTGMTYEEYVEDHLFQAVGMEDSYYCSENEIRSHRAHGYDAGPGGLLRKSYLDHTWPYSAGSLCSTVGDLLQWNQALHQRQALKEGRIREDRTGEDRIRDGRIGEDRIGDGRIDEDRIGDGRIGKSVHGGGDQDQAENTLLSLESYRALITPVPLKDGSPVRYAMGLGIMGDGKHRVIEHGGGINGFLSDGKYYPEEELLVVALQNSTGPRGPSALTGVLAELVLGPAPELEATPFTGEVEELVGTYTGPGRGRPLTLEVSREEEGLTFTVAGTTNALRPVHLGDLTWGSGSTRLWFVREGGKITQLRLDQGSGHFVLKRDPAPPEPRK